MAEVLNGEKQQNGTPRDWIDVLVIVLIGCALRGAIWWMGKGIVDSDEAIVGLMAKHILDGRDIPVFYYGQHYMGSFEPIVAALAFSLFGISGLVLKAVPLFFSLIHILLMYLLALRFTTQRGAKIAALCTAIAPSALVQWSSMARGGFIELVVVGTLSLLLASDLIMKKRGSRHLRFFFLGIVLGFGWWINNQMIFYMGAIGICFPCYFFKRFPWRSVVVWAHTAVWGFFLGSAPFWYANLIEKPRFATFHELMRPSPQGTGFFSHAQGFFDTALPIILGARQFWSKNSITPGLGALAIVLYFVLIVRAVHFWRTSEARDFRLPSARRPYARPWLMLVVFLVVVPIVFSASGFGWLSQAPRYLLPLYSVLPVLVGTAIAAFLREPKKRYRFTGACSLTAVFGLSLLSNFYPELAIPGQPFVAQGDRVVADHQPLYRWLNTHHYRHIVTNYWIGYRVAFETQEAVTFSLLGEPRQLRIPSYEQRSDELEDFQVLVLVPSQSAEVTQTLARYDMQFRQTKVGGYVLIDHIRPSLNQALEELPIELSQLSATSRADWLGNIIDDEPGSRWGSGAPQQPGMQLSVRFSKPEVLGRVEVDHGVFGSDIPRALSLDIRRSDGSWCNVVDASFDEGLQLRPISPDSRDGLDWNFIFSAQAATEVRLTQQGQVPLFDWSVADLRVFRLVPSQEQEETKN